MTNRKFGGKKSGKKGDDTSKRKTSGRSHATKRSASAASTKHKISAIKISALEPSTKRSKKNGTVVDFPCAIPMDESKEPKIMEYNPSEHERTSLARMIMKLFELWGLTTSEQLCLLGYRSSARATLLRYKNGEPFGTDRDRLERVGHLLAIHASLRTIYKFNPEMAYVWPKTENKIFGNKTPIEFIIKEGFIGLVQVRTYLDVERFQ